MSRFLLFPSSRTRQLLRARLPKGTTSNRPIAAVRDRFDLSPLYAPSQLLIVSVDHSSSAEAGGVLIIKIDYSDEASRSANQVII